MKVVCFWRLADWTAYHVYLPGTFTSSDDIECEVPSRVSSLSGVTGPSSGETVYVTVSVYDNSVGDVKNHADCWSDGHHQTWGTTLHSGSSAEFTYDASIIVHSSIRSTIVSSSSSNSNSISRSTLTPSSSSISRSTLTSSSSDGDGIKEQTDKSVDNESADDDNASLSLGLVAGVAVGAVLIVAVVVGAVMMHRRKSQTIDVEIGSPQMSRQSLVVRNGNHCEPDVTYEEPCDNYYDSDPLPQRASYAMPADQVVGSPVVYDEATQDVGSPVVYDEATHE